VLKVCVEPPAHLSRAMFRVADALRRHAPAGVEFTGPEDAELQVLHVVALDTIPYVVERPDLNYAVIQYCYASAGEGWWNPLWDHAKTVWSYYDLPHDNIYMTPLGVDPTFASDYQQEGRGIGVMTSGYVTGPYAEAIEEVYLAANRVGKNVVHLGPVPQGFKQSPAGNSDWRTIHGVSDLMLANYYRHSQWVSGLRHVEGFEFPVIEGLACGARPIVFDRADMRRWYDEHALFVPECHGEELIQHLVEVMSKDPEPVTDAERTKVLQRFNWEPIVKGFWERVL